MKETYRELSLKIKFGKLLSGFMSSLRSLLLLFFQSNDAMLASEGLDILKGLDIFVFTILLWW